MLRSRNHPRAVELIIGSTFHVANPDPPILGRLFPARHLVRHVSRHRHRRFSPYCLCLLSLFSGLCCAAFVAAKSRRSGRTDSSVSAFERTMTSSLRLNGGKTRASVDIPRRVIGGSQTVHCAVIVSADYGCASAGLQAGAFCGRCKRARDLARGVCAAALAADVALA